MYDLIHSQNGKASTSKSYFHNGLAYKLVPTRKNPQQPLIRRISAKFDYLYRYNIEAAYTPIRRDFENHKSHKKRLYTALLTSTRAAAGSPEMHIQKLWPNTDWTRKWKNLKDAPISDNKRCICYQVVHDLTPTNVRLYRMDDTLEHRLTA